MGKSMPCRPCVRVMRVMRVMPAGRAVPAAPRIMAQNPAQGNRAAAAGRRGQMERNLVQASPR